MIDGALFPGSFLFCRENVCGIDPGLELDSEGRVKSSPDMDRRIEIYKRFYEGYGEILVQVNVEDTRLGVAEYGSSFRKSGLYGACFDDTRPGW